MSASSRRTYTDKFKRNAVARLNAGEGSQELAKKLKISTSMLYVWRRKVGDTHKVVRPTQGNPQPLNKFVVVYLKQGEAELMRMLREGEIKRLDKVHRKLLDALEALELL